MDSMAEIVLDDATSDQLERAQVPVEYLAAYVRVEDVEMFAGADDKDVRKSLRVGLVSTPELAPDEALVAVMASSINYNTVWSAMFEPVPTFGFLRRFARTGGFARRHDQPYHVLGSDASGVIVRVGPGVRRWRVGDHVVVSPVYVDDQQPATHADGIPVGIVSSGRKAQVLNRLGCDIVINRDEIGLGGETERTPEQVIELGKRLGEIIRARTGGDPHIVLDYTGRATFGVSVFAVGRGGVVVTCGSSTGYQHQFDNRYLWMNLKCIIGSHGANLQEQSECLRLFSMGSLVPTLSTAYPLVEVAEATRLVQANSHIGKVGVRCLAPEPGLGVTDPELRARIGETRLSLMRDPSPEFTFQPII
jgi:NADPH:quinone reductase-like Zn-dependent oxidoreductase